MAAAALLALPAAHAQAPQGGRVAHGSAAIGATAAETRVRQTTDRAIIDWRSFDVGRDHRVAFDQPGARSATLNRVQSGRESTIAGQVTAPGTVIIQNSHGVVFTGTSRIDVGGLVATSRGVDAGRFMADGRLEIRAASAEGAGGAIELVGRGGGTVRVAGLLDASGAARGGAVTVTGERVRLAATARVAASGRDAVGSVRIGGDRQGTGTLRRAGTVTMEAGARIEAKASADPDQVDSPDRVKMRARNPGAVSDRSETARAPARAAP